MRLDRYLQNGFPGRTHAAETITHNEPGALCYARYNQVDFNIAGGSAVQRKAR